MILNLFKTTIRIIDSMLAGDSGGKGKSGGELAV
jgi:hypothetical protein